MSLILKLLDLLLLAFPLFVELFKKERGEKQKAIDFVKDKDKEKIKTYESMQKKTGEEASRISWERIKLGRALARRRLLNKVSKPKPS